MIGELKPYSAYKDSGISWIREVPEHWEARKLRIILRAVSKHERPDLPLRSIVHEKGVILRDVESKEENHNYTPDDLRNYKVVQKGQFAMNKMKAWQGSYGISEHDGIVSPAYFIFNVSGISGDYLHRAIRLQAAIDVAQQEILLLHEFRTRLIADVVTGKLDVREAAAHLPAEVDGSEAIDEELAEDDLGLDDDSEPDADPEDEAA